MCIKYFAFALLWFPGGSQSTTQACDAPTLDGGFFAPKQETYSHGTKLSYTCNEGLVGNQHISQRKMVSSATFKDNLPLLKNNKVWKTLFRNFVHIDMIVSSGAETVNFYSDGNWCELPTCEEAFCVVDPARYARYGLVKASSEYMREGEMKPFPCTTKDYYINVRCTNISDLLKAAADVCRILRRPHVTATQRRLSQFIDSSKSGRQMRPSFPRI
ncbi:ficolin [Sarotherodon galilaeus]